MENQICRDGRCYPIAPDLASSTINVRTRECVTLASLNRDIADAKRSGTKSSLDFRELRKKQFMSGTHDSKLIASGCAPFGNTTKGQTQTQSKTNTSSSQTQSGCAGGRCGQKTTTSRGCSAQQKRTGTCGQRKAASVQTASFDMGDGGNRGLLIVGIILAVGATGLWAYRTGKLNGVIAQAKGLGAKFRKK